MNFYIQKIFSVVVFIPFAMILSCGQPEQPENITDAETNIVVTDEFSRVIPRWAADNSWLDFRAREQAQNIKDSNVFHDFSFSDQRENSQIGFIHRAVEDGAKTYKGVHYDHGTGIAAADINGDGLIDVYFVNQIGANELWLNNGDGSFRDFTSSAGVGLELRVSSGASFADIDNDGDQDLFVTTIRGGNALFQNDGFGRFKDISAESGLGYVGHSAGSIFFDYDKDGLLDLYVTNIGVFSTDTVGVDGYFVGFEDAFEGHTKPERTENSILYHNQGENNFIDVSSSMGIENSRWSGDVAVIDGNNDGWSDLYIIAMQGPDGYYENQQGEGFIDKTKEIFPNTSWGAMGVQVFDWDNDGDQDIYVTDMHSDMAEQVKPVLSEEKRKAEIEPNEWFHQDGGGTSIWGNAFFRNEGDGTFTEISDDINAENFWPWGLSSGDLNADGFQDVFIASSMNYPWRYGINSLLLNDEGKRFVDAEFSLGIEPRLGNEFAPWFDLACGGKDKGHKDCSTEVNAQNLTIYGALGSRSSVIFDVEGDGDLDIVANEFHSPPLVFISNLSEKKDINNIKITLEGNDSNRNGFGATVSVTAGNNTYTQVATGKSGYMSQSNLPLYFGLAEAKKVDSISIEWPSGNSQKISGPFDVNQTIPISESGNNLAAN
ncbi:MAG: CRTAC1 family protein [Pseudomonadota bacterium]|nr:CRTAC1 family protein [Pseudomonadota bacterium]